MRHHAHKGQTLRLHKIRKYISIATRQ